ncbi:MAG: hypothetical protein N2450_04545 [bacterium]|nr:hypothetical protein [bacterium]
MKPISSNSFLLHFLWLIPIQVFLAERISIGGIIPDFFWLGLVWSLFQVSNSQTYLVAFIGGIVLDAFAGIPLGTTSLVYITVLFIFAVYFTYQLTFSPIRWFVLSSFGNIFVTFFITIITLYHSENWLYHFFTKGLLSVLYTALFSLVITLAIKWKYKRENT